LLLVDVGDIFQSQEIKALSDEIVVILGDKESKNLNWGSWKYVVLFLH